MSYSTPFSRDDDSRRRRQVDQSLVAKARLEAGRLPAPPPLPDHVTHQQVRQDQQVAAASPPVLELLAYHEEERAAARAAGNVKLADRALIEVVHDLDVLLDSTEGYLSQKPARRARQRVRDAVPHLVAIDAVSAMPLREVAGFLGLPPDRVDAVIASLARHGGIDDADRKRALEQIRWLRDQLQQVEITRDHSLLDRVLRFVSRFVILGFITLTAAAAGAFSVSESVVKEVVKTAVIMLVGAALQLGADQVRVRRDQQDERDAAREAHAALLSDLAGASTLWQEPAFEGDHAVTRLRLATRMCAARVASIPLEWQDKWQYWDLLDEIAAALATDTPHVLAILMRQLKALTPPR